jgi:hypothetical protein
MKPRFDFCGIGVARFRERFRDSFEFCQHFHALACERRHPQCVEKFGAQARVRIARHSHVIDLLEFQARFLQAIANGLRREPRGVFDAVKALFFHGCYEPPIAHNGRGRIAMVGVDPKNIHRADLVYLRRRSSRRQMTSAPLIQHVERPWA